MQGTYFALFEKYLEAVWLEDLHALRKSTEDTFPDSQKRHKIADDLPEPRGSLLPNIKEGTLLVKAKTPGQGQIYDTSMLFSGVNYKPKPKNGQLSFGEVSLRDPASGNIYYMDKLGESGTDVKVNCTCPDFEHTFRPHNHKHGALLGNSAPMPGSKKNPTEAPGMCKHLMRLASKLKEKGIMADVPAAGFNPRL